MGRLTLRKFYLLLGEYYHQQRVDDGRVYRLLCVWVKNPPELKTLFPSYSNLNSGENLDVEDSEDDVRTFNQVTAALTPYREG